MNLTKNINVSNINFSIKRKFVKLRADIKIIIFSFLPIEESSSLLIENNKELKDFKILKIVATIFSRKF